MAEFSTHDECMAKCLVCGEQILITVMLLHEETCNGDEKNHESSFESMEKIILVQSLIHGIRNHRLY